MKGLCGGAANNLKYPISYHISIVSHNVSVHDANLFNKKLGKKFNKVDIAAIAENKEKYISFNIKIKIKLAGATNKSGEEVRKMWDSVQ